MRFWEQEEKDIRIWEDQLGIVGFVLYLAVDANPELQVKPEYYGTPTSTEMVEWALARAEGLGHTKIEVSCLEGDLRKEFRLKANGFVQFDDPFVFLEMNLSHTPLRVYRRDIGSLRSETDLTWRQ